MRVSFEATRAEFTLIVRICERYEARLRKLEIAVPERSDLLMDITAAHCNGCKLKLVELLEAEDFDFAHDVSGIRSHINRENGRLEGQFLPRYAAPERAQEVA